jgi:hypothetical protein
VLQHKQLHQPKEVKLQIILLQVKSNRLPRSNLLHPQRLKRKNQTLPHLIWSHKNIVMMMKSHLRVVNTYHLMNMKNQSQTTQSLAAWNTRPEPPRTQNKSSLNNSKRSKAKHPSYQSRENKPIQKLRFWNRLSIKAVSALSLTGHRLSQNSMPMLVAKSLLLASKSMSCSPRKPWELLMAWVTGRLSTREKPNRSPEKDLTAT